MSNIFGKMLFDLIGDGAEVALITKPPNPKEIGVFERLEQRNVQLHFHETLHAKIFLFEVDQRRTRAHDEPIAIVGSANLTQSGLAFAVRSNEEFCYELRGSEIREVKEFAAYLKLSCVDLQYIRLANARRRVT
jgi:HKD family nuclease